MPYEIYTLEDLQTQLAIRADEVPFWDSVEAKDALNEALMLWNALTGEFRDRVNTVTVIGQARYELPSTLVFGFRVEYNSSPLAITSTFDMDNAKPGWEDDSGTPRKWIPIDLNTIQLYPTPNIDGVTITIDGIAVTPQLTEDADYIQVGSETLGVLIGYALHVLAFKEGGERFKSSFAYFQDFLNAAAEQNSQLVKSAAYRRFLGLDMKRQEQPTVSLEGKQ